MNPFTIAAVVFICTFGGAMVGMGLRAVLPQHHVSDATKETIQLCIGLVAMMTALVLGLLMASAKDGFDEMKKTVEQTAVDLLTLDRTLARYGPETAPIRADLKHLLGVKISTVWPERPTEAIKLDPTVSKDGFEGVVHAMRTLAPANAVQLQLQSLAVRTGETLLSMRWVAASEDASSMPLPFLLSLMFWLTITFTSFGLFAPRHGTVIAALLLCSASVAIAVLLTLEMDRPLDGLIKVSPTSLHYAYAHMGT